MVILPGWPCFLSAYVAEQEFSWLSFMAGAGAPSAVSQPTGQPTSKRDASMKAQGVNRRLTAGLASFNTS